MSRPVAVLRPEPGNAATVTLVGRQGLAAIPLPLFAVRACAWTPPDPAEVDALLLTSANAVRHAGPGLAALAALPVLAVGAATARGARGAGLCVRLTGDAGASALLAQARAIGLCRALHLAGRERLGDLPGVARVVTVYASDPVMPDPAALRALAGAVALVHSPRAARRLGMLVDAAGIGRAAVRIAALSDAVATAAGAGWERIAVAAMPTDDAIVAAGRILAG